MDRQFAFAVILVLLGFGLLQFGVEHPFLAGIGIGTVIISSAWIAIIVIREVKRR